MNFTELLLNSYQYDIKEAVDNSVRKIKTQRNQQQQKLRNIAQKSAAVKAKEAREAARQEAIDKYKKARTEYQLAQDEMQSLRQKKVSPSAKEKIGQGIEKAGEKLQKLDVTDPVAIGRSLAKGTANLPSYLVGKGLSKLGSKLSGSEISKKEYEKQRADIYNKEADKRLAMDAAEVEAMGRQKIPNPEREVQKEKQKQQAAKEQQKAKEKQELKKTAKKMGTERLSAAQKIEQELRAQGQQEKQQAGTQKPDQLKTTAQQMGIKTPNLPTRSQQTTVSGNTPSGSSYRAPVKGQSTQNQPQKERSFGSSLYANRPDAARAASQMRRGYTGDLGDIRYTKPTQTNFPTTQQQTQTTTPQPQQSTSSLAQRKQTVTNKPQLPQNTELTKPTREIQREINPEPTAGQPPQGSKPEAFARPQKPQQSQQQSNNKSLQQRKRFSAPSSKRVIPGSSSLGSLSKVVKRVDPSGYGDN